jgi:16S rRNA (guanine527-N7)-methyltransferase
VFEYLAREASVYGIKLTAVQIDQFRRYLELLTDWSQRANLVGDGDPAVVVRRHMLESIAFGAALREREILRPDARVLDLGAGAGFPGLVLKIVWPVLTLTMIDATAKKTAFLSAVVDALELHDTTAITGRAETLAHDDTLRGTFDLVAARAVAPLAVLLELALPFARVGGRMASPKGSRASAEIAAAARALEVFGGKLFSVPLHVSGPPQTLVVVAKQRETPPEYPRRTGLPARAPL